MSIEKPGGPPSTVGSHQCVIAPHVIRVRPPCVAYSYLREVNLTRSSADVHRLSYTGDFSLAESVSLAASAFFVIDQHPIRGASGPSRLDVAFPVEGPWRSVGVRITQDRKQLQATICSNPAAVAAEIVWKQIEQMLAIDVDGSGFPAVAASDIVLGKQLERRRGVRPLLLPSPYEAAARAIIGQRLFVHQAATLTASIAAEHGVALQVGDRVLHAFPEPKVLAKISAVRGLADRKVAQLRALGRAAVDGELDRAYLRELDRGDAIAKLQRLPGIGPFSAELILLRGVGDPDAFPLEEKRLHRAMARLYDIGEEPGLATLEALADRWRPYRSWGRLVAA